jgi:hypothetical protein
MRVALSRLDRALGRLNAQRALDVGFAKLTQLQMR